MRGYRDVPPLCFVANNFPAVPDLVRSADFARAPRANRYRSEEFCDHPLQKRIVLVKAFQMAKFYKDDLIYAWVEYESAHSWGFDKREGIFDIRELETEAWSG